MLITNDVFQQLMGTLASTGQLDGMERQVRINDANLEPDTSIKGRGSEQTVSQLLTARLRR